MVTHPLLSPPSQLCDEAGWPWFGTLPGRGGGGGRCGVVHALGFEKAPDSPGLVSVPNPFPSSRAKEAALALDEEDKVFSLAGQLGTGSGKIHRERLTCTQSLRHKRESQLPETA